MATLPPWLDYSPQTYLQSMQAGAHLGLARRQQDTAEQEAGDRMQLSYDQLAAAHQERQIRAAEALRAHNALELHRQALERHQLAEEGLSARAADSLDAYRKSEMATQKANQDLAKQRLGLEEKAEIRADTREERNADREERLARHQDYMEGLAANRWTDEQKAQWKRYVSQETALVKAEQDPVAAYMKGLNPEQALKDEAARKAKLDAVHGAMDAIIGPKKATTSPGASLAPPGTGIPAPGGSPFAESADALTPTAAGPALTAPLRQPTQPPVAAPMSQAELDALPDGALFVNPSDGNVRRKKGTRNLASLITAPSAATPLGPEGTVSFNPPAGPLPAPGTNAPSGSYFGLPNLKQDAADALRVPMNDFNQFSRALWQQLKGGTNP